MNSSLEGALWMLGPGLLLAGAALAMLLVWKARKADVDVISEAVRAPGRLVIIPIAFLVIGFFGTTIFGLLIPSAIVGLAVGFALWLHWVAT